MNSNRSNFTWYSLYGIIVGFVTYGVLIKRIPFNLPDTIESTKEGFLIVLLPFIPLIVSIFVAILLNWVMIRITKTNHTIISEIKANEHDHRFKNDDMKERTIKALRRGRTSTISGAIIYINIILFINSIIMAIVGVVVFVFTLLKSWGSSGYSGGGGGVSAGHIPDGSAAKAQKMKEQAQFKARQDQKHADYLARQYVDQFNYNSKYADNEKQRYIHAQKKANESRKRANRM